MAKAIYEENSNCINKVNNDFSRIILRSINKYSLSLEKVLNDKNILDYISDEYKKAVKSFNSNSDFRKITGCTDYEVILSCLEANMTKFAYEFGPCDFYENMMDEIAKARKERKTSENKMMISSDIQMSKAETANVEKTEVEIPEPETPEINEIEIKEEPKVNEVIPEEENKVVQPNLSEEPIENNNVEESNGSLSAEKDIPEEKEVPEINKVIPEAEESEEIIEGYETGETPMEVIDQLASNIDESNEDTIEDIPVPADPENSYEASSYYDELEEKEKSEVEQETVEEKTNKIPDEENEGIPFFKNDDSSEKNDVVHEHNQFMPFEINKDNEEKTLEENRFEVKESEDKLNGFILDNLLESEQVHNEPKPVVEPPHEEPHREIKVEDIPFFSRRMNQ